MPTLIAFLVAVLFIFILCAYQLRISESVIATTFGKPKLVDQPGLHWRFPWPIQKITRYDNRKQLLKLNPGETVTNDNINLIVELFCTWNIEDPILFFNSVGNFFEAESILKSLITSERESVFRKHSMLDIVKLGKADETLSVIESELQTGISQKSRNNYGINIDFVGIAQINLHESNTTSIFNKMIREQEKLAAEIRSEGEKNAKIIRDNANNMKAQKLARAEAEAKRIRGEALIKAAEQYEKFNENLDFAIFLRKLDALEETMKTKTTIILDPETPPYDLLKYKYNRNK